MESRDRTLLSGSLAVAAAVGVAVWLEYRRRRNRRPGYQTTNDYQRYALPAALTACPYRQELELALRLAYQAGDNMIPYCDATGTAAAADFDLGIATKTNAEDFCTKIDVLNEELITQAIRQAFPDHQIIGEER